MPSGCPDLGRLRFSLKSTFHGRVWGRVCCEEAGRNLAEDPSFTGDWVHRLCGPLSQSGGMWVDYTLWRVVEDFRRISACDVVTLFVSLLLQLVRPCFRSLNDPDRDSVACLHMTTSFREGAVTGLWDRLGRSERSSRDVLKLPPCRHRRIEPDTSEVNRLRDII